MAKAKAQAKPGPDIEPERDPKTTRVSALLMESGTMLLGAIKNGNDADFILALDKVIVKFQHYRKDLNGEYLNARSSQPPPPPDAPTKKEGEPSGVRIVRGKYMKARASKR